MKMLLPMVAGLLVAGLLAYFFLIRPGTKPALRPGAEAAEPPISHPQAFNLYLNLRNQAIHFPSDQLGLPAMPTRVYGVVMDWEMDGVGIATTVAFASGEASMYTSTGGGQVGAGMQQEVATVARMVVAEAQRYVAQAALVTAYPLPAPNHVCFYFLTNAGTFSAQEAVSNFENESSPWLPFFEDVNRLITEMRFLEQRQQEPR